MRLGNSAGVGSVSVFGKMYLKNTKIGTSFDSILVVASDGGVRMIPKSALFVKTGGTASQFLKANGSVDNNTYALSSGTVNLTGNQNNINGTKEFLGFGEASTDTLKLNYFDPNLGSFGTNVPISLTNSLDNSKTEIYSSGIITPSITFNSFIKNGGLPTQFLMANGSVNSNTYSLSNGTNASGTWGINILGNAGSAINWGGRGANFDAVAPSNTNFRPIGLDGLDGIVKPLNPTPFRDWLGLSTVAYNNLLSVDNGTFYSWGPASFESGLTVYGSTSLFGSLLLGGNLNVSAGNVMADAFIIGGGTADQFLKANGTLDNNTYALSNNTVNLTGNQTISGTKNFNGEVKVSKYYVSTLNTAPSSASDTGTAGEIRYTTDYIYICIATNTWKRSALSSW